MILGIMQPYFFPYLGYFELIRRSDRWVVFDTAQYRPKSWMNRNRILHPARGWQYIHAPVAGHDRFAPLCDIRVKDRMGACERVVAQLGHYRKHAPHYRKVIDMIVTAFGAGASDRLTDVNVDCLSGVCKLLGISFEPALFSAMGLPLGEIRHPGEWALKISAALGADEYLNPPNGRELFDAEEFRRQEIVLSFTDLPDFTYACGPYPFIPYLSIVDVLMWNDALRVRSWLEGRVGGGKGTGPAGGTG